MERPKCQRCGGPLDLMRDPDDGILDWSCNNLVMRRTPAMSDEEFQAFVSELADRELAEVVLSRIDKCR